MESAAGLAQGALDLVQLGGTRLVAAGQGAVGRGGDSLAQLVERGRGGLEAGAVVAGHASGLPPSRTGRRGGAHYRGRVPATAVIRRALRTC